jgi:gliding motility-associated transport system ATP-binding protein
MIEVNNLVKKFGNFTAVNGISFTAEPGQVTGFLGPNGAGKTTTMRMLTGYSPPSSGSATVAGYDIFEQSMEVRKNVGYLPETVPLYRDMTAVGYLMYLAEIRGVPHRRDRALHALGRVGLVKRAQSEIRTLSKGMRQRVGLASALLHDPEVLILDEPTIGLDPIQVLELRDLIIELGREHTLLLSTHILSEAEQVCDRVIIINQGEIISEGAPIELRNEMERGSQVLIRLEEGTDNALSLIHNLSSVAEASVERDTIIAFPENPDIDPRPDIARALISGDFNVLEIRPAANTLEEIFLAALGEVEDSKEKTDFTDNGEMVYEDNAETPAEEEA